MQLGQIKHVSPEGRFWSDYVSPVATYIDSSIGQIRDLSAVARLWSILVPASPGCSQPAGRLYLPQVVHLESVPLITSSRQNVNKHQDSQFFYVAEYMPKPSE